MNAPFKAFYSLIVVRAWTGPQQVKGESYGVLTSVDLVCYAFARPSLVYYFLDLSVSVAY